MLLADYLISVDRGMVFTFIDTDIAFRCSAKPSRLCGPTDHGLGCPGNAAQRGGEGRQPKARYRGLSGEQMKERLEQVSGVLPGMGRDRIGPWDESLYWVEGSHLKH